MNQKTVLVVEDEALVGLEIREQLTYLGYTVPEVVSSGDRVLEAFNACNPDLILMDIRIKGQLDGIQAAAQIRQTSDVPILFLTSYSDTATVGRAADVLPDGYLLKPFSERELIANVELVLLKAQSRLKGGKNLQKMAPIIDVLDLSLILFDHHGILTHANAGALNLCPGLTQKPKLADLIGASLEEINAPHNDGWFGKELPVLGQQEPSLHMTLDSLTSPNGIIYGYLASLSTMGKSERLHLERSARAGNETLLKFLPKNGFLTDSLESAGFLIPSPSGTGDFYDIFPLGPTHFLFYNLDVAGHGSLPAMIVYALRTEIREHALSFYERENTIPTLPLLLQLLNQKILSNSTTTPFFTLTIGILNADSGDFKLARAGHTSTLWIKTDLSIEWLHGKGNALGAFNEVSFEEQSGSLQAQDRLILCSDGVIESLGQKDLDRGYTVLEGLIKSNPSAALEDLVQSIQTRCLGSGETDRDDMSLLALNWNPGKKS